MNSIQTENNYNKIAKLWDKDMIASNYGLQMVSRAIRFCKVRSQALDVGCGSGGRLIHLINENGFDLEGVDISQEMIAIASQRHPETIFYKADILEWETDKRYDFIIAWDSIFHIHSTQQAAVITKLCDFLNPEGILLFTIGDATGDLTDTWHDLPFSYGSLGISKTLKVIEAAGCECRHLELDQYPDKHVSLIVKRL